MTPVGRKYDLIALPRPDEAQPALAFVQLAITRADIALDAAVVQNVPKASQFDVDGLNHVAHGLRIRNVF